MKRKLYSINMEYLKRSTKKPQPGDIFVFKNKHAGYMFGMVVTDKAKGGGFDDTILVYIYNNVQKNRDPMPELKPENLIIPPIHINQLGWTDGFFITIGNKEIKKEDLLSQNCFYSYTTKKYYDEYGNLLKKRYDPCGVYGLANHRHIDDQVSKALGVPLAPIDKDDPYEKRYPNEIPLT
jgi:hypothetical protein